LSKLSTLNSRIILMLLASTVMVLALVGGVFLVLITNLSEDSAENELSHGLELLQIDLKGKRSHLIDGRSRLENDAAILASTNLIWKYQNINDYQPLLFDIEKEALARLLARDSQGAGFTFAAIYTAGGEVVSFYDASSAITGYVSYDDASNPVAIQYHAKGGDASALDEIPLFLNGVDMHFAPEQGIHFRLNSNGKRLIMETSSPLLKRSVNGDKNTIGWLRLAYVLDEEFAESIANKTGLAFAIHTPSVSDTKIMIASAGFNPRDHNIDEINPHEAMDLLNLNDDALQSQLRYHHVSDHFTGALSLELEYSGLVSIVFGLDKGGLLTSLKAFQLAIFWVLLVSGLLVIPIGVVFTRRSISKPINSLVSYVDKVGYSQTNIAFVPDAIAEFNYLGESMQDMVERLHESQQESIDSENNVRLLLDSAGEGIYGIDADGCCTFVNPKALDMLGYQSEEFIGKNIHDLVHHTHGNGKRYHIQECPIYNVIKNDHPSYVENEPFWCKDGSSFPVEYRAYPIHRDGKVAGSVVTFSDITERKRTENSLQLAKNIIENANEAIMVTNNKGIIEQVNDAYVKITGFSREEAVGATPKIQESGRHDKMFYALMWKDIHATGHWEGEIWDRRKDGDVFPKWLSITTMYDEQGNPDKYVGVFSDITVLKETEKELENLAYYDALTGLPNRVLFKDRLNQGIYAAKRDGHKLAALLIDLDRFKYVNDTLGHDAGDELLQIVAKRLASFVRETDTVARQGGDEFTIVLSEINDPEDSSIIAQNIINNLKEPIEVKGNMVNIGASIGIATYPDDGIDFEQLLKNADLALYKAKDNGRNNYQYFSTELQSSVFDHIAMEDEMLKGIDGEQFILHYQPKINLATNRMTGMEALVRWNHPDKGFVRPDLFIPFAEETGLIIPMGLWIFKTACKQLAEFNVGLDEPLKVAINLSAGQFKQRGLVYAIKEIMGQYKINPEQIELEITESSVMGDVDAAIVTMNKFRDLGLKLSIDDFGTGYSSLSYLKKFPISTLKIDQSFVRDLTIDSDDAAIVQAIISLAHSLELDVIAEGVETQEQLDFLKYSGCQNVQGYLLSKPLPAEEFKQYIKDNLG